ncbi:MAG TPA: ribonuclease R, partial [Myxococcales bacterium]|nr:ribonuclease R [Myxococcales bacterium]
MALDPGQIRGALLQSDHPLGVKELIRALGLHPGQQTAVKRALRDLLKAGAVQKLGKRYFIEHAKPPPAPRPARGPTRADRPPRHDRPHRPVRFDQPPPRRPAGARRGAGGEEIEGILHVHRDGFGFVHPLEEGRENIFLPAAEAARALDHDRVKIEVVEGDRGRSYGRLLEVLDRVRE